MEQDRDTIIPIIKKTLLEEKDVVFCYLFGSVAYGNAIRTSDIDIAVYLAGEKKTFFEARLTLLEKLSRALKKEVDVVVLNTAPPFLKYAVLKEGMLMFERNAAQRIEFELKSLNEYFDYQPILKLYRARLRTSA